MYSGRSKVEASSFIVATKAKIFVARESSRRRRATRRTFAIEQRGSDAHDFSLMRLPSRGWRLRRVTIALTIGSLRLDRAVRADHRRGR